MYKECLKSKSRTFEGKYDSKEYISMPENRIRDINQKLKRLKMNQKIKLRRMKFLI